MRTGSPIVSKSFSDFAERVYIRYRDVELSVRYEIRQLRKNASVGGVGVADPLCSKLLDGGEVNDTVHTLRWHTKLCDGEFYIAAAEKVEEGVNTTFFRGRPEAIGEAVA
jgi:hypothetical protein